MEKYCVLYACDSRGVYIPQYFAESHNPDQWDFSGCYPDSLSILKQGPDNESYWDAWQDILDYAKTRCGMVLHQDGDLWVVNFQRAIDDINEYCQETLEYEESNQDAGDNYSFLVSEGWCSQKTRDLISQIKNPPAYYCTNGQWESWWVIDTMGLNDEDILDIALESFDMVPGSVFGPYQNGLIILDSFPIQEVCIDISTLGIPYIVLCEVMDSCEAYIPGTGDSAYMTSDAVWYATINPLKLQKLIKERVKNA